MNELNIYSKFNYIHTLKKANDYFNTTYKRHCIKTILAPENGTYSVSLNKWNIRICYWDEHTKQGKEAKKNIKNFIEEIFSNKTIYITSFGCCDIINELNSVKIQQIR